MAEIAETASHRAGKRISFISVGQKNFPHEILIVPQKWQKWQKWLRWLIRKIPLFNFLKFLTLKF